MSDLIIPQEILIEAEATVRTLHAAEAFCVTSLVEYSAAGEELKAIKGKAKALEERRLTMTRPLDESKARIMDFFRTPAKYLADAETAIKRAMGAFDEAQRKRREEAERIAAEASRKERERLQTEAAKAEQSAREKREKEEAKARELEAKGRQAEADARRKAADEAEAQRMRDAESKRVAAESMPMAPVVHMEAPKASGVSSRQAWKFEITNVALLPREYLLPDDKAIGGVVRALGDKCNIPGVRVYAETIISSRSA